MAAQRDRGEEACRSRQIVSISFAGSSRVFGRSRKDERLLRPALGFGILGTEREGEIRDRAEGAMVETASGAVCDEGGDEVVWP